MFPTQGDEPVFHEDPSIFELDNILDDLLADCTPEGHEHTAKVVEKRPIKTSSASKFRENKDERSSDSKKTVHRDIERQRRKEMSALYASLRSLLPLEYVKGRRATSDHMHQAVNYIKDLKKTIEEMKMRRDMLKKLSGVSAAAIDAENPNSNINDLPYDVKVDNSSNGMEILIKSRLNEKCFPLSKVLADLLGRGLNVISCVSTRGDRDSLHKVEIELDDAASIDPFGLQERLAYVINVA